jgi:hypothetical protein
MSPGLSIAHYCITSKLGEGGMGEVWRATDTKLNRDVAIKILPEAFAKDPDRMARFAREAQVLASLNHPNIAAIYGVEERALVMELVEGETLPRGLPPETGINYARQIAEALEYAHDRGVVHRDLKPANIKVTPDGKVKVLDFGLAVVAQTSAGANMDPMSSPTRTMGDSLAGTILGTAAYMSPEQARGQTADRRSDIWAFGAVLYEMLTGRTLFAGPTISDTLAAVLKGEVDVSAIPGKVRPVVERCLRREPKHRWQAIGDVRMRLEEGLPVGPALEQRRSLAPWTVAAILAVAAVTLAVELVARDAPGGSSSTPSQRGPRAGCYNRPQSHRCDLARRPTPGLPRARPGGQAAARHEAARPSNGDAPAGHGEWRRSFLLSRWPVDRILRPHTIEEGPGLGRRAFDLGSRNFLHLAGRKLGRGREHRSGPGNLTPTLIVIRGRKPTVAIIQTGSRRDHASLAAGFARRERGSFHSLLVRCRHGQRRY